MKRKFGVVILIISLLMIGIGIYFTTQDKSFTVSFIGVDNIPMVTAKEGTYIKRPDDPVKVGYKFIGWFSNGKLFDFNKKIEKDIVLEAKWEEIKQQVDEKTSYIIDFQDEEGNSINKVNIDKGMVVEKPTDPEKEGYRFIGWFKGEKLYDFNREVTDDMILTSKFEKIITYTVSFDSNGGSKVSTLTIEEQNKVIKPKNPTREGYTFISWQLDGKDYDFNTKVTKDIILKAIWKKKEVKYTVKFDSVGGNSINSQIILENEKVIKPKNPTKVGYTFISWQLNGKDYDFNTKVTKNITLKATWRANPSYTATFDTDGGSNISSITVVGGSKIPKPEDPVKVGYIFKEWQLNDKAYDFNTVINSNITLKAIWELEK